MSRLRFTLLAGVLAFGAVGAPASSGASHAGPDEPNPNSFANGAGRVVLSLSSPTAAGDTVEFSARRIVQGERIVLQGSLDYVASGPTGQGSVRWRGRLECLVIEDDAIVMGGVIEDRPAGTTDRFSLRAVDRGTRDDVEGDSIEVVFGSEAAGDCADSDFGDLTEVSMARGDVTVHDAAS